MEYRAYWRGEDTQQLSFGQEGIAFRASGYHDPESAQFLAWLFRPNGDENAYYCDGGELEFIEEEPGNGYLPGTIGAATR